MYSYRVKPLGRKTAGCNLSSAPPGAPRIVGLLQDKVDGRTNSRTAVMTNLDPASLADLLGTLVLREASTATFHFDEEEDGHWCVSWRIGGNADR